MTTHLIPPPCIDDNTLDSPHHKMTTQFYSPQVSPSGSSCMVLWRMPSMVAVWITPLTYHISGAIFDEFVITGQAATPVSSLMNQPPFFWNHRLSTLVIVLCAKTEFRLDQSDCRSPVRWWTWRQQRTALCSTHLDNHYACITHGKHFIHRSCCEA